MGSQNQLDYAGLDIVCNSIRTGATTPGTTGTDYIARGVPPAGGNTVTPRLMQTGDVSALASTDFTDYTVVTTETIRAEVFIPANTTVTGIAVFNGSAVAGNLTVYLINGAGLEYAHSASTAQSGTDAYQRIPFTAPVAVAGPATAWVAVQGNNTGAKINTHTVGNFGADKQTGTVYGTLTAATAPSTFTTGLGPVASLY